MVHSNSVRPSLFCLEGTSTVVIVTIIVNDSKYVDNLRPPKSRTMYLKKQSGSLTGKTDHL